MLARLDSRDVAVAGDYLSRHQTSPTQALELLGIEKLNHILAVWEAGGAAVLDALTAGAVRSTRGTHGVYIAKIELVASSSQFDKLFGAIVDASPRRAGICKQLRGLVDLLPVNADGCCRLVGAIAGEGADNRSKYYTKYGSRVPGDGDQMFQLLHYFAAAAKLGVKVTWTAVTATRDPDKPLQLVGECANLLVVRSRAGKG